MNLKLKQKKKPRQGGKNSRVTSKRSNEEEKENLYSLENNRVSYNNFGSSAQPQSPREMMPPAMTNSNSNSNFSRGGVFYESGRNESSPGKAISHNLLVSPIYDRKMNMNNFNNIISPIESGSVGGYLSGVNNFYLGNSEANSENTKEINSRNTINRQHYSNPFNNVNFIAKEENILNTSGKTNQKQSYPGVTVAKHLKFVPQLKIETPKKKIKSNKKLNGVLKLFKCRCDKSKCVKKYCDCFANAERCDPKICKCSNCVNIGETVDLHSSLSSSEDRSSSILKTTPPLFCNCTKSSCKKQYCECFKNNRKCNNLCRCLKCFNSELITYDHCEHINVQIANNQFYIETYSEVVNFLKKKSRSRNRLFNVLESPGASRVKHSGKTPLFTTTCETVTEKSHPILKNPEEVKKKLEMKNYRHQTIFNGKK